MGLVKGPFCVEFACSPRVPYSHTKQIFQLRKIFQLRSVALGTACTHSAQRGSLNMREQLIKWIWERNCNARYIKSNIYIWNSGPLGSLLINHFEPPRNGPAAIGPYPTQPRGTSQYFRTEPARLSVFGGPVRATLYPTAATPATLEILKLQTEGSWSRFASLMTNYKSIWKIYIQRFAHIFKIKKINKSTVEAYKIV